MGNGSVVNPEGTLCKLEDEEPHCGGLVQYVGGRYFLPSGIDRLPLRVYGTLFPSTRLVGLTKDNRQQRRRWGIEHDDAR